MTTLRERIAAAARSQIGSGYYSMNYSAADGFCGWMGTNYVGEGWGCAQLAAFSHNTILGTRYAGSCYNFAGDALGQSENQGGGEFVFTDDPQPGDLVLYIASGHDGTDYDDYGHTAVYVGGGMVVGAWGKGVPGTSGYWPGRGVSEDAIGDQSLGGGWRFVRCTRLDGDEPAPSPSPSSLVGGTYRCNVDSLNVRDAPSLSGNVVASYSEGQTVVLDEWYEIADGYVWGRYTGASSGQPRYVALGPNTGKEEADDYLVRA